MSVFEHHIFVCTHERPPEDPKGSCLKGAQAILDAFKAELISRNLKGTVRANKSGCLDQCALGPTVVIYPEGHWYARVTVQDVPEIVTSMLKGEKVKRILHPRS